MQLPSPTWLVGCGNMAGAMVEGWRIAGIDLSTAIAIRPSGRPVEGVRTVTAIGQAGPSPALVLLGFKPQQLDSVAPELAPHLTERTTVVSILAGVEAASLKQRFPGAKIVRAIPNLPVAIRRGFVGLYSDDIQADSQSALAQLFSALGMALWTDSEKTLGGMGAVGGAGPAYVARFIDAIAKAGVAQGLPEQTAFAIALETVFGTAWLASSTRETMDQLARRVASPKGTTEAGLAVLDGGQALDRLVEETIEAAAARGRSLAQDARLP
ncbi:NAD(P)-binding domain-containing protein [Sphingomonas sinipercae]|uniref:Pyrroline-5-carboxylate reductase n=1 Tax=Sphingomonas sinipercae TaxID=2714944 RepID=A0A6G7ZNW8_9SPHN|nr:pyrroline-5-carboxylate reductase dimerization domain-containing protein [Sphingomonas sinipercae]QIL02625.1 NAD(P)-binding domain-containing protein [Sphingomonas sinipercae]